MTLPFEAPGPGAWSLDAVHFSRPAVRLTTELFPAAFARGFAFGAKRMGLLLSHLEYQFIDGVAYTAPRAVGAPRSATRPPPRFVFALLKRLHPEIRRRMQTVERVFTGRLWREDLARWDSTDRPAATAQQLALQRIDPASLTDAALVEHLRVCREHVSQMIELHHRFTIPCILAVGDFIVQARGWTGATDAELTAMLRGASPGSSGAAEELAAVVSALKAAPAARALLDGEQDAARCLAGLRALASVRAPLEAWLEIVGHRLVDGIEIGAPFLLEVPEVAVRALRASLAPPMEKAPQVDGAAALRARVPAEHQSAFDALLAEARLMYRLRDERGLFTDIWANGIMRRAVLEGGRRLVQQQRLQSAVELIEAGFDEICGLLTGGAGPSAQELAKRREARLAIDLAQAPATLGPPDGGPPPAEWLSPAQARAVAAAGAVISCIFSESKSISTARVLRGVGVSTGVYEGTARVVRGADEMGLIRQGDVLIARTTTAAFNSVLPLLGAIITDRGGVLSHAAIVAREFGIPAIVGTREATALFTSGARIRVDGARGEAQAVTQ